MSAPEFALRRMPYPYRAMLAICSDLDETPDRHVYWESMRFLNTTDFTSMGRGVGLEVGNTIYFDMPADQFSYWNTDDAGRDMVRALIRSGHVDCLHSFGDFADRRARAAAALDELTRYDCRLEVWIDHAVAPSNFGADIMRGRGDVPGDDVYHADLSCDYGIRYVWRGRVTSVIGQDVPRRLGGIFDGQHPLDSTRTIGKEVVKGLLGRRQHVKYAMHGPNELLRRAHLRDGREVQEFLRCNPFWGGVQHAATADGVAVALTPRMLDKLIEREGLCVFYTHLGKIRRCEEPFDLATRQALAHLAEQQHAGQVLTCTTRRLLGYRRATQEVNITTRRDERGLHLDLTLPGSDRQRGWNAADLGGLTLYVDKPDNTFVSLEGRAVQNLRRNPADHTGRCSVSLPRTKLEFPSL